MKPNEIADAIGYTLGLVVPDIIRGSGAATSFDELHATMQTTLTSHLQALQARPDGATRLSQAVVDGMARGLETWFRHHTTHV